jgi:hypothetical protein
VSEEREWFCPQCGVTRLGVDEDGCCTDCGATCCRMSELRALLSRAGWVFDEETKTFWHMANFLDPADKGFALTIERMRELLATRDLALVPAADVPTPIQDAAADDLEWIVSNIVNMSWLRDMARAELARRAAKEGT